jgi:hypothetical protein
MSDESFNFEFLQVVPDLAIGLTQVIGEPYLGWKASTVTAGIAYQPFVQTLDAVPEVLLAPDNIGWIEPAGLAPRIEGFGQSSHLAGMAMRRRTSAASFAREPEWFAGDV